MTRRHLLAVAAAVALLAGGRGIASLGGGPRSAEAGPLWDAGKKRFVTGDGQRITFWKMDGDRVVSVQSVTIDGDTWSTRDIEASGMVPAASEPAPAGVAPAAPAPSGGR
jgi:hypothetical protein